jgi:hypothetical protein
MACQVSSGYVVTPYPPDLGYVPQERIDSSMWVLAAEIGRLDELIQPPIDPEDQELRAGVRASLDRMLIAARRLETPGRSTPHHPVLTEHLGEFIQRLERARRAVDRTPPDYFQASALAGGCFLCHGSEQATARLH